MDEVKYTEKTKKGVQTFIEKWTNDNPQGLTVPLHIVKELIKKIESNFWENQR